MINFSFQNCWEDIQTSGSQLGLVLSSQGTLQGKEGQWHLLYRVKGAAKHPTGHRLSLQPHKGFSSPNINNATVEKPWFKPIYKLSCQFYDTWAKEKAWHRKGTKGKKKRCSPVPTDTMYFCLFLNHIKGKG